MLKYPMIFKKNIDVECSFKERIKNTSFRPKEILDYRIINYYAFRNKTFIAQILYTRDIPIFSYFSYCFQAKKLVC